MKLPAAEPSPASCLPIRPPHRHRAREGAPPGQPQCPHTQWEKEAGGHCKGLTAVNNVTATTNSLPSCPKVRGSFPNRKREPGHNACPSQTPSLQSAHCFSFCIRGGKEFFLTAATASHEEGGSSLQPLFCHHQPEPAPTEAAFRSVSHASFSHRQ